VQTRNLPLRDAEVSGVFEHSHFAADLIPPVADQSVLAALRRQHHDIRRR
jgi:hypothetical protein